MEDDEYLEAFERCFTRLITVMAAIAVAIVICAVMGTCFASCTTTEYVPVPEYHYDHHHTTDTLLQRDSVITERETVIREADSALLAQLGIQVAQGRQAILVLQKELQRVSNERQEVVHDTVIRTDSIRVPQPVERKLTKWEQVKMDYGAIAFGGSIAAAIAAAAICIRRLRKTNRQRDQL